MKGKGKLEPESDKGSDVDEEDDNEALNDPLEADEEFEDIVDRFESSYNFRFEEPYVYSYFIPLAQ